jgi:beta-galactosidase
VGGHGQYHAEHPDQPNVGTEQASTVSTRGIYANDKERGYVSAYDDNAPSWAHTAETWWSYFADRPWLSGGFVWTGLIIAANRRPILAVHQFAFRHSRHLRFSQGQFLLLPVVVDHEHCLHLLPHWNWPGKEGQEIRVDALSNCKQVELFLNGESLGKQAMKPIPS